jgi:hypothetical protein
LIAKLEIRLNSNASELRQSRAVKEAFKLDLLHKVKIALERLAWSVMSSRIQLTRLFPNRSEACRNTLEATVVGMRETHQVIQSKSGDIVDISEIKTELNGLKESE